MAVGMSKRNPGETKCSEWVQELEENAIFGSKTRWALEGYKSFSTRIFTVRGPPLERCLWCHWRCQYDQKPVHQRFSLGHRCGRYEKVIFKGCP